MARDIKKIDAKGRFFIPSKRKEELGTEMFVTNSLDKGYLCVYSKERFEYVKKQFEDWNDLIREARLIRRTIIGEALPVTIDSQGRISITSELWDRINAKPGDEICVFDDDGKLDICTRAFYEQEDHDIDISKIMSLQDEYYVKGL